MTLHFTVAIPTYNGEHRLPRLLEALRLQSDLEGITWEIIVVDNNSTDGTAKLIRTYQRAWNLNCSLRYCFEPEQGAAFARQRAIREAQGDLVGFLDDDNLPAPDWIAEAVKFGKNQPQAAAYSGKIHGVFEVDPPTGFKKIQAFLAIRNHGNTPLKFKPETLNLPPGATFVVRRQAWLDHVPAKPSLTGRINGQFLGGEDYEVLLYLHKANREIWYSPQLQTYHQIPKQRLDRGYLLTLARGCGLATCQLRMINARKGEASILIAKTILGNLRRIIVHLLKYHWSLKTDLIAAFELQFYWGSLLSPFYLKQLSQLSVKTSMKDRSKLIPAALIEHESRHLISPSLSHIQ